MIAGQPSRPGDANRRDSATAFRPTRNRILAALEEATARHPAERKLLVCRERGEGRELLRRLALRTGGWMGWEAATIRDLAGELAFVALADRGLRTVDGIEQAAVVDAALDRAVEWLGGSSVFRPLADGLGFRTAIAGAVEALRLARLESRNLRPHEGRSRKLAELRLVLEEYLAGLDERRAADHATVLAAGLESFEAEFPLLGARVFLLPGLGTRGLSGVLLARLLGKGGVVLEADPVFGLPSPPGLLLAPAAPAEGPALTAFAAGAEARKGSAGGSQLQLPMPPPPGGDAPVGSARSDHAGQLELPIGKAPEAAGDRGRPRPTCLSCLHAPEMLPPDVEPVAIHLFRASSPGVEIREVLRRVVSRGIAWDQVEIVATDPVTYGCALDVLASRLEIPVTYGVGLPLGRSRLGRALRTYLLWLEEGLHARPLWEALESGEIVPPQVDGARPSRTGAARALRRLRIGWSAERYRDALRWIDDALKAGPESLRRRDEDQDEDDLARRWERRSLELRSVRALLGELLRAIPRPLRSASAAHPSALREVRLSAGELAGGALRFLGFFRARGPVGEDALARVRDILQRVEAVCAREAPFASALAELRRHLAIRMPPPGTVGTQPWSSAAGKLHLTALTHGGSCGRPHIFVVGLDADRAAPRGVEDPLLSDRDRDCLNQTRGGGMLEREAAGGSAGERAVSGGSAVRPESAVAVEPARDAGGRGSGAPRAAGDLPTTRDILEESRYALASLLASLRGEVTLSYSGWEASDGSVLSPSPVLLQALRLRERDAGLGFDDLERKLGDYVSPVPQGDRAADDADVWLAALSQGPLLLGGEELVRSGFPLLASGLGAERARAGDILTPFHGRLGGAYGLDPRDREDRAVSASGLEKLAACPLAWLYRYGLEVKPPEDPEYDPGRWLTPLERGSLLHGVFERFGRAYRARQDRLATAGALRDLEGIVEEGLEEFRRMVPPPSPAAYAAEVEEIHASARAFLRMEAESREGEWEDFELAFGFAGADPARIVLENGRALRVRGRIDRTDRLPDGSLRVVDYKTGRSQGYERLPQEAAFKGGRQIQAGLYTRVVEALKGKRVRSFEYRFPTTRGESRVETYERPELDPAARVIGSLLDMVAGGLFLATDQPEDCRFCDYARVCRVRAGGDSPDSPPARWSQRHRDLVEYAILRGLRERGP